MNQKGLQFLEGQHLLTFCAQDAMSQQHTQMEEAVLFLGHRWPLLSSAGKCAVEVAPAEWIQDLLPRALVRVANNPKRGVSQQLMVPFFVATLWWLHLSLHVEALSGKDDLPLFRKIVLSLLDQHTASQVCLSFPSEMSRLIQPRRELFLTFSSKNLGAGGAGSSHGSQQVPASEYDSLPRPEALHEALLAWILLKRCSSNISWWSVCFFLKASACFGILLVCESLLPLGDVQNHHSGYLKHSAFFWTQQSFSASDKDWLVFPHFFRVDLSFAKLTEWHWQFDISILSCLSSTNSSWH